MEMEIHETYVSYDVAELLKEAGFDWGVYSYYCMDEHARDYKNLCFYTQGFGLGHNDCNSFYGNRTISAPTLDVAQRWLREVKGYFIYVEPLSKDDYKISYICRELNGFTTEEFSTYEEAQEAGVKKALELILE